MNLRGAMALLILVTTLISCSSYENYGEPSLTSKDARISVLNRQLFSNGVWVVQDVERMSIVIPNGSFFNHGSANLSDAAYMSLGNIVELMNFYDKSFVSVTGYSGINELNGKLLSVSRANKILNYLWKSGINANFVYASGSSAITTEDKKLILNDCVVIDFKKLID